MTKKAELAFARLLRAFNKKRNVWKRDRKGNLIAKPGRWVLDSSFGGFVVEEITNKSGGTSAPFRTNRKKAAEFVRWINDTIEALRVRGRR